MPSNTITTTASTPEEALQLWRAGYRLTGRQTPAPGWGFQRSAESRRRAAAGEIFEVVYNDQAHSPTEIAALLGMLRPRVVYHLRQLVGMGLMRQVRDGYEVVR